MTDIIPTGCGRCEKPLTEKECEYCWFCMGMLCVECWDKYGHCGHKRADEEAKRLKFLGKVQGVIP